MAKLTAAQADRQDSRDHRTGKYTRHLSCELCGRPAGKHYFSDERCNSTGLGLVLDWRCGAVLALLSDENYVETLKLADTLPQPARVALRKRLLDAVRDGRAGCTDLHFCDRGKGPIVGVYRSAASGMENDSTLPWTVVCELHHTLVSTETKSAAVSTAASTKNFCDECRETTPA